MALPFSGSISIDDIKTELGITGALDLTDSRVRTLAGVPSGSITLPNDFWGKSSFSATITPTAFYASGRSDGRRPGTAQVSGNITATGGVAPYTYGHQLANQSGYAPTVTVGATGSITVRFSSTLETYMTGDVRGVVTDSQGKVTYTLWAPYELTISSTIIGPEV